MKFHIGQKIICDNNQSGARFKCSLEKGEVYTVKGKYACECGSDQLILKEEYHIINMICKCGRSEYRYQSYYEWRFRPYVVS